MPDELIDATRADGASDLRIFHTIVLPISIPPVVTVFLYSFMWSLPKRTPKRPADGLWPVHYEIFTPMLHPAVTTLRSKRGRMATGEFSRHVVVALGPAGTMRDVSTVIEASECLVDEFWPDDVGLLYSEALRVCLLAMRGKQSAEAARLAFIAAARDSDILIIGEPPQ